MTIQPEQEAEIRRLFFTEHWKVHSIATQLDVHADVVKRVTGLLSPKRKGIVRNETLLPYRAFLSETLERYPDVVSTRLFDMVRERGYTGSTRAVRRFVKTIRPVKIQPAFLQIETLPGEQAQIDWAHVGTIKVPGGERALWAFVMVLSHSRAMWAELVLEQTALSVRRSLLRSVRHFGGCTRQWLFDNPKTIVLERYRDAIRFHPTLLEVCSKLNVDPRLCGVRRPQHKGKVERAIRFLKDRFFAARPIHSLQEGNVALLRWIDEVANAREHPTQRGKTVADCLLIERAKLLAPPISLPDESHVVPVGIDLRARFQFDGNVYSAPAQCAATTQQLVIDQDRVVLMAGTQLLATHARCWGRGQLTEDPSHVERRLEEKPGGREPHTRTRLIAQIPAMALLLEKWVAKGESLHARTRQYAMLVQDFGVSIVSESVAQMMERAIYDSKALPLLCQQNQRRRRQPATTRLKLGAHVQERDVTPHGLESYDE